MPQPVTVVDAFTDRPYAGNPAAVCLLPGPANEGWMQSVAREMNLSETAFLHPRLEGDGYSLRWFTPEVEVDLCGHATLASAHVLWAEGILDPSASARFLTRSGWLSAARSGDWIELDLPSKPVRPGPPPANLREALGSPIVFAAFNAFDCLVEVPSEEIVRGLRPDFGALRKIPVRGIIVTARSSDPQFDFVSRFFAPNAGVDEDPVTGSAHCCLGPYWAEKLGKNELLAYQASRRGGILRVLCESDRVILGGQAVTTLRGEIQS